MMGRAYQLLSNRKGPQIEADSAVTQAADEAIKIPCVFKDSLWTEADFGNLLKSNNDCANCKKHSK